MSKRKSMKLGIKPYKFSWNLNHLIRFTIFNCTLIKHYYYFRFVISRRIIFAIFSALSCSWLTTKIPPLQLCLMDKLDAYNISSFSEAVIHSSLKWSLIIPSSQACCLQAQNARSFEKMCFATFSFRYSHFLCDTKVCSSFFSLTKSSIHSLCSAFCVLHQWHTQCQMYIFSFLS